ncbi:MAG: DUF1338 domain-containing protein [Bdellovibrionaceae bacterium]|nr:DUF1338 domain-containing protein [Pseudobdellovibrionaceae bacterium]MDW8189466.1 DUF1338 domain-containing protein [Pseudobdellovibrionaceae bacterium]
MRNFEEIMQKMWQDYIAFNPQAKRIYELFLREGERVVNDHIALRTFRRGPLGIDLLARPFRAFGYEPQGEYFFQEKKLYARHYEAPNDEWPKIFISELLVDQLSHGAQEIIDRLVSQVSSTFLAREDLPWAGRPWNITLSEYERLAQESEYAAWVAVHGFRPNHFTVSVNHLIKYNSIEKVNELLIRNGFVLNQQGGAVKGSPQVYLEQSSTMAEKTIMTFVDGKKEVPACYYEFAKRYPLPNGKLYQGFVEKSADKIFESTNMLT